MFKDAPTESVLTQVRAHDFGTDPVLDRGAHRIDAIVALDRGIRALQAEQLAQIAGLHSERTKLMPLGTGDPTLSVIGEVAMARNIGPTAAGTQVGVALVMAQMPAVFALFATGVISEATVRGITHEVDSLHVDDLIVADGELAPKLPGLTTAEARRAAARVVISIDAEAAHQRATRNRADQRVSMFPDEDGVAHLHVRGPAEQILAAYKALDDYATGLRATGDPRTRGQIMCQTLVERVTGLTYAEDCDVELNLVLDAKTLVAGGDTPVELTGYGPICPDVAEEIIARAPRASVRRLFTDPVDGTLAVREPRRRRFDRTASAHIRTRDQYCRQPGCDLKVRHDDHVHAYEHGGLSVKDNGQGLCPRSHTINPPSTSCREVPPPTGWSVTTDGKATVWSTPTGHQYRSDPPPLLPGHLRQ
ncbi:HNH endonuclease [Aeromicrobium wangtongii]|uniref:HNH endonuclease n=1 Tax=Aeromicrobium wangtongii TaxID=2969247 RepID=UPI002017607B|nr:HNH endonuclease [Aeromicrobium wangtongii]MCL3816976.1 HNH endonuclease [Aeromicrobium wangtongii]